MADDQNDTSVKLATMLVGGLASVAILGAVDHATGVEISFSIFYLAPIGVVAWFGGRAGGLVQAVAAALVWGFVERQEGLRFSSSLIPLWNALVRLGFFVITAWLVADVRHMHAGEARGPGPAFPGRCGPGTTRRGAREGRSTMMRTRWMGLALTGLLGLGGTAATPVDACEPLPLAGRPFIAPVADLSFGTCFVDEEGNSKQTGHAVHLPPTPGGDLGPQLEPGTRLRVTMFAPETQPRIGLFEALQREHLVMRADERSYDIPLETIRRIDVSRGHRPSVRGGLFGALVGGLVGSVSFGYLANRDDYGVPGGGQDDTKFLIGGIVGGLAGGALGALIGREERWEPVEVEPLTPRGTDRTSGSRPGGNDEALPSGHTLRSGGGRPDSIDCWRRPG